MANYVNLKWSGARGGRVVVQRDGRSIATTANDGAYTDALGRKPNPSYVYQVCEVGGVCSSQVVARF